MNRNYRLEFEIPGLPKTPNQLLGAHWRTRSTHASRWHASVRYSIARRIPSTPLRVARLTLTRCSSRQPDADNLRGSFKPVVDALTKCGVIKDDNHAAIGEPICRWEKAPQLKGKIRVKVESLDFLLEGL